MDPRKRIALVAHDNKKTDLLDWVRFNRMLLVRLPVRRLNSKGGNMRMKKQQLIMIADRDDDERGFLKAVLKLKGFRVVEAVDGREVITLAQAENPDLLLVNLTLPRVAEAIRRLRNHAHLKHLPLLTVSAKRTSPWQRQLAAQSTRHLTSPIEVNGFCQLIESFLSRSDRSRAVA